MIITPLCQTIIVRYARKPIWMPTARSKLFRIAEHTFYSPEEIEQIKTLDNAYKAQEESIKEFMKHEFYIPATQAGGLPMGFVKKESEYNKKLLEENDRENAKIAEQKEQFLNQRFKDLEGKVLEYKFQREENFLKMAAKVDEYIIEKKADGKSFVTPENFESIVEEAMAKPINHEFCIDRRGRIYK